MNSHHASVGPLALLLSLTTVAAQSPEASEDRAADAPRVRTHLSEVSLHPEPVESDHEIELDGRTIRYRASAGTLPLYEEADGTVKAEIFHVAYLGLEREGDRWVLPEASTRPILFLFNGGPGSSSVWLHLGAFGPRRVVMGDVGNLLPPPWGLASNEGCLLDVADLVFIDPVTTGYSRAAEGEDDDQFHGLEADAEAVAEFIRLFVTRHGRWQSPKFIGGESYGTTRAAALSEILQERHGMFLHGIVLVSSVLDFGTIRHTEGNDMPHVLFLPTYAATAWYHGRLDRDRFPTLISAIEAAEDWAIDEYLVALARGASLPDSERASVVERYAELTGIDPVVIERANLRLDPGVFRKELLRSERRTVGRLDSRFVGFDADAVGDRPEYDPSYSVIQGPYTAAMNHYLRMELGYESDLPYEILTGRVWPWDYSTFEGRHVNVSDRLRSSMVRNPDLRVFMASGYFDLATPHFAADYVFDHLQLEPAFRRHLVTRYYPAGHMMYVNDALRIRLSEDVRRWLRGAVDD